MSSDADVIDILGLVGNTPVVALRELNPRPEVTILAKLEGFNPCGSVKDRIALYMIEGAEERGELYPGKTILEPTSGNTGIGLAMVASIKGYPLKVLMPETMSVERRRILQAFGAEVVLTPGDEGMNGAIARGEELVGDERYYIPNQFANSDNVRAHYEGTGREILDQAGEVDVFVAGIGTGGTITGVGRRLKEELDAFSSKYNVPVEYADELDEPSDDIIIVGKHSPEDIENLAGTLAANGILCLAGDYSDLELELDIGRIHYSHWRYVGTTSGDLSDAYKRNERNTLQAGGVALFPGGAGAMGQMHVQLALEGENSRRKIVVTDTDDARLRKLEKRMRKKAEAKGIDLVLVNPEKSADEDAFFEKISEEADGGFDDIVMLVPVSSVVSKYARLLGPNGLMNIFAGIPAGSNAKINVGGIVSSGHRYIGSSGSNMDDIRYTLQLTEEGKLSPVYALAAIGGMNSLKEGLEGLMQARFPGKTVIYPNALEMPLVPVEKAETICPGAGSTLIDNEILTKKTEEMIRLAWE